MSILMKFHFSLNPKAVKTSLIHEAQQSAGISQKQGQTLTPIQNFYLTKLLKSMN